MKPWTEAHRREALRRTYELAAEIVGAGIVRGKLLAQADALEARAASLEAET